MKIYMNAEGPVTRVTLISEEYCWITFGDDVRVELTLAQLEGIVEHFEQAKRRESLLAQLSPELAKMSAKLAERSA